jgi:hypothetical protein
VGDVFRGGLHVRDAGVNVTRPLVTLAADSECLSLSTMRPWGWLIRQREFARAEVTSVRVSDAGSWMLCGVELTTTTEGIVTFWSREPSKVMERLSELGWPVKHAR